MDNHAADTNVPVCKLPCPARLAFLPSLSPCAPMASLANLPGLVPAGPAANAEFAPVLTVPSRHRLLLKDRSEL